MGRKRPETNRSKLAKMLADIRKDLYDEFNRNFNRQLRKVTKNKSIFLSDFALTKSLYLAMADASQKWTSRIRGWDQIIAM